MSAPSREELLSRMDGIGAGIDALKAENAALRAALQGLLEATSCNVHAKRWAGFSPDCSCRPCVLARNARACLDRVVKSAGGGR